MIAVRILLVTAILSAFAVATSADETPPARQSLEPPERPNMTASPLTPLIDAALTPRTFSPEFRDAYYPAEETAERQALRIPSLIAINGSEATLRNASGELRTVAFGLEAWDWDVVTTTTAAGAEAVVLERHFADWGLIAYVGRSGLVATVRKAVGDPTRLAREPVAYPPRYDEAIIESEADLLGERVLRHDADPSFEACAAFLPDLTAYTFLSDTFSDDVISVAPDGRLGALSGNWGADSLKQTLFDPLQFLPPHVPLVAKRGILGGYLPAVDYAFRDGDAGVAWEMMALARPRIGEPLAHALVEKRERRADRLDALVCLRLLQTGKPAVRRFFRVGDEPREIAPGEFYCELLELQLQWKATMSQTMEVDIPEQRLLDASLASLVRAMITYNGLAPRYGTGYYHDKAHNGFPPTTISMVEACIEWGLLDRARGYLDYYLDYLTLPDGTFNYYGPAVAEYGEMLRLIAAYARRADDARWLRARAPKATAIAERLLALRRASQRENAKGTPRHGLIPGAPEADNREDIDYYFSGDMWVWRGWTEIGRAYAAMGDAPLQEEGRRWLAECDAYRVDIETSIEGSIVRDSIPPFIPPLVGLTQPFERVTEGRLASYTNYRYWLEMLSSGFLRPEWADAIIAYRTERGGEALGATRFMDHLDNWPYAHYAYGLMLRDRVRHYLLGFYGDLALHRMHGTFSGYEQVAIRGLGERPNVADYCVPAQLVAPVMLRWMLAFEEPDADVLWLARATPKRWLAVGQSIGARGATTRWGTIDFRIERKADGSIAATVDVPRENFPPELCLRFRTPEGRGVKGIAVDGAARAVLDEEDRSVVRVRELVNRHIQIAVRFE